MSTDVKPAYTMDSLLQAPGELLDVIFAQLSKVGIDLPAVALQIFFLGWWSPCCFHSGSGRELVRKPTGCRW
jgi:hypothetical protein